MSEKYLVAVSGGSDSMALLDMSYKKGYQLVVAHVNYAQRETALRDQIIVEKYCNERNIKIYIDYPKYREGNFQAWARERRYDFFKELVDKEECLGVLVGHHYEDLLETYLIQKKRKTIPLYWGLREDTTIEGLRIIRPLLSYHKKELIDYCVNNSIEYGEDESNMTNKYLRNKIRNVELQNYDKEKLFSEISTLNNELASYYSKVNDWATRLENTVGVEEFNVIEEDLRVEVLRQWLINQNVDSRHYSINKLNNILVFINSFGNRVSKLDSTKALYLEYGCFYVDDITVEYSYVLHELKKLQTPYFKVVLNPVKGVRVSEDDFPITIRSFLPKDMVNMKFGKKLVRRLFIDKKIMTKDRKRWPIVVNKNNEIVLVPKIASNVKYISNNPNFFVVE